MSSENSSLGQGGSESDYQQYSTFKVADRLYGIDVTAVQEVVRSMAMTPIPLAERYVKGLINLRGQVATAIGMHELFGFEKPTSAEAMNVVCKCEGNLISLLVDEIGDVMEVPKQNFEPTPQTVAGDVKRFMVGVYKIPGNLLSIIDTEKVLDYLNK